MTQKSEQIAKQVALKAAVKLTKDKFDVEKNITEQLEVIKQISNNLLKILITLFWLDIVVTYGIQRDIYT